MLYFVIIDDDSDSLLNLKSKIVCSSDFNILAEFHSIKSAINTINNEHVDIIFLDIKKINKHDFDYLKEIKTENPPALIITSSNPRYAYEAFKLNAVDFLLKPYKCDSFYNSISKAILNKKNIKADEKQEMIYKNAETKHNQMSGFMFIKNNNKYIKIICNDVLTIEGKNNYSQITTLNAKYEINSNLKKLECCSNTNMFIKINKSTLVNINHINSFENNNLLVGDKYFEVSRTYKNDIINFIKAYTIK